MFGPGPDYTYTSIFFSLRMHCMPRLWWRSKMEATRPSSSWARWPTLDTGSQPASKPYTKNYRTIRLCPARCMDPPWHPFAEACVDAQDGQTTPGSSIPPARSLFGSHGQLLPAFIFNCPWGLGMVWTWIVHGRLPQPRTHGSPSGPVCWLAA